MSRELLLLVDALAREKNVDKNIVIGALELALASATKKRFTDDIDVRVEVDPATGEFKSFRRWQVVADELQEVPARQFTLAQARERNPEIDLEQFIEEPLPAVEFGRIGAQAAKQVILQKIRDAEREQILSDFLARGEHLVTARPDDPEGKFASRRPRTRVLVESRPREPRAANSFIADHAGVPGQAVRA